MKKYWLVFKNSAQGELAYRFNFFALFFAEFFSLAVFIYLWASIYRQGNQIGTYSLKLLIAYYILTRFINLTVRSWDVGRVVGDLIREGWLNNYMVKPINFLFYTFFSNLGSVVYKIFIYIFIFLLIVSFIFKDVNLSFVSLFYFLLFLVISFIINFLIFYLVGVSTFYFEYIMGFNFVTQNIVYFFSGNLMPIDIFPPFLFKLADILPFKYIVFIPVSFVMGREDDLLLAILVGLAWIIVLYFLAVLLYKKGIKKYEAFGL